MIYNRSVVQLTRKNRRETRRRRARWGGLALAVVLLGATSCAARSGPSGQHSAAEAKSYARDNQVELYGRHRCSICRSFVAQLEARQLRYHFYDLDRQPDRAGEMWALIREHHPDTKSVGLPVVRVNGIVLIRPDFARFETYLKTVR